MTPVKFVKFYTTGVAEYQTYEPETKNLIDNGITHGFADGADAQAKSTEEVFIFWDGQPIGRGALAV